MTLILVVDDSKFNRGRILSALKGKSYELAEAEHGQSALDRMRQSRPNLVVTDQLMPVMDGFELLKSVREEFDQLPVIVMSADIQTSSRRLCEELRADLFLNKPCPPEELCAAVERLLDSAGKGA